jgi:hypothetical protein
MPPFFFVVCSHEEKNMARISIKAVLIGNIVDIAGSFLVGFVAFTAVVFIAMAAHVPRGTLHRHGFLTGVMFAIGLLISAVGGYVAARIAGHDEMLNGGLSSFLCVLVSLFEVGSGHAGAWLSLLIAPSFAVLGGYLRMRQMVRKQDLPAH